MAFNTFVSFQIEKLSPDLVFNDDTMINEFSRLSLREFEGVSWTRPAEDIFCYEFKNKYGYYDTYYHKINNVNQCYHKLKLTYIENTINQMRINHKLKILLLERKKVVQWGKRKPLKKTILKNIGEYLSYIKINSCIHILGTKLCKHMLTYANRRLILLNKFGSFDLDVLFNKAKEYNRCFGNQLINLKLKE